MRRLPERLATASVALVLALAGPAHSDPEQSPARGLFDTDALGDGSEPLTVTADSLEYNYGTNVVVYTGEVVATQGAVRLRSDHLSVTFERHEDATGAGADGDLGLQRLQDIVAVGRVRIEHGPRWATGEKAVFDQRRRTLVLTGDPVLHEGANEVAGERVVVYLDEDRSVVEGGRRRVKAVLYPKGDKGDAVAEATERAERTDETAATAARRTVP
jgi:lipopolysaccharide export system protein LptA